MATQGPLFPGTVTTQSVLPEDDNDWTTPGNISANDGAEATITAATYDANDISFRLKAQNFGFTIPSGATIDGITVEIEKRDAAIGAAVDNRVQLLDAAGALVGDNKADTVTDWPTAATIVTYGGAADSWNASPTVAMVNDPDFGVVLSVKATAANTDIFVDFIRVTVHYTVTSQNFPQTTGGHTLGPASAQTKEIAKSAGVFSEGPLGSLSTLLSHNITVGGFSEGPVASVLRETGKALGGFSEAPLGGLRRLAAKNAGGYSLGPSGALARAVSLLGMGDFAEAPVVLLARLTAKQAGGYILGPIATLQAEIQAEPQFYFQTVGGFTLSPTGILIAARPIVWNFRPVGARRM